MKYLIIATALVSGSSLGSLPALADDGSAAAAESGPASTASTMPTHLQPMAYLAQPPDCLQETGTHIPPKDSCVAMANGRSYARDQLTSTRSLTLGEALSRDPDIMIRGHH